ncbi:TPA: GNAT family N-acetyltransferase [Klebsiella pneumoniae]|nr:GNAT family N-acetyltransferase [Klebsiella pneumoniae]
MFEQISVYDEDGKGSIEGYKVSSDREQIVNWFAKRFHQKPDLAKNINVAFLNNLYIDEDSRGEGKGTSLVSSFIEECFDCHFIFLECDNGEDNPFSLSNWYESFGFEILYNGENPIMVLENSY